MPTTRHFVKARFPKKINTNLEADIAEAVSDLCLENALEDSFNDGTKVFCDEDTLYIHIDDLNSEDVMFIGQLARRIYDLGAVKVAHLSQTYLDNYEMFELIKL